MVKTVIVTGVSGQDGSYMVDYLLENTDHQIYGVVRRASNPDYKNITGHKDNPRFKLIVGDLSDSQSMDNVVRKYKPDYFINFAAQSFVASSWDIPEQTFDVDAVGVLRILEAIRKHTPYCRTFCAGSSEEMGDVIHSPQIETDPLRPRSPYGAAKAASRFITKVYRESYNLYAVQAWSFNHESPRRHEQFVTRKITKGLAEIKYCIDHKLSFESLKLGNIEAKRDWSHAKDVVDAVWRMLNQDKYNDILREEKELKFGAKKLVDGYTVIESDVQGWLVPSLREYIVASGETHSVREFITKTLQNLDLSYSIKGKGIEEKFLHNGQPIIEIDEKFYRPAEVQLLHGNPVSIKRDLKWEPEYTFDELVREMVNWDKK